jgi:hypothetical protein
MKLILAISAVILASTVSAVMPAGKVIDEQKLDRQM